MIYGVIYLKEMFIIEYLESVLFNLSIGELVNISDIDQLKRSEEYYIVSQVAFPTSIICIYFFSLAELLRFFLFSFILGP